MNLLLFAEAFNIIDALFHVQGDNSRKYESFVTHSGKNKFLFMPFGLLDSLFVFYRYVYNVLKISLFIKYLLISPDKIIISFGSDAEILQKVQHFFTTTSQYGL